MGGSWTPNKQISNSILPITPPLVTAGPSLGNSAPPITPSHQEDGDSTEKCQAGQRRPRAWCLEVCSQPSRSAARSTIAGGAPGAHDPQRVADRCRGTPRRERRSSGATDHRCAHRGVGASRRDLGTASSVGATCGGALVITPVLPTFRARHPRIEVEVSLEDRFVDIVVEGYAAGVRLSEAIHRDMVQVRLTSSFHFVVVGAPEDLTLRHARAAGGSSTSPQVRTGRRKRVLDSYAPTVPGFFIYYPSRATSSAPLSPLGSLGDRSR